MDHGGRVTSNSIAAIETIDPLIGSVGLHSRLAQPKPKFRRFCQPLAARPLAVVAAGSPRRLTPAVAMAGACGPGPAAVGGAMQGPETQHLAGPHARANYAAPLRD